MTSVSSSPNSEYILCMDIARWFFQRVVKCIHNSINSSVVFFFLVFFVALGDARSVVPNFLEKGSVKWSYLGQELKKKQAIFGQNQPF